MSPHPSRIIDIEDAIEFRRDKRREAMEAKNRKRSVSDGKRGSFFTRRRAIHVVVIAIVIIIGGVSGVNVLNLQSQADAAKDRLQATVAEKARLEKELAMADNPSYIEDQARDKLRMIMKGETLYVFSTQQEDNSQ